MAKHPRRVDKDDPRQTSLLDLIQQAKTLRDTTSEGSLCIQPRLSHCMSRVSRASGLSRFEIAGRMSHLLGQEITVAQLDSWTAESKTQHRPPAEFLPAFCVAVGNNEPLHVLTDAAGLHCLPGPEVLRAEIQKLRETEKELAAERRKHELFLQHLEGVSK